MAFAQVSGSGRSAEIPGFRQRGEISFQLKTRVQTSLERVLCVLLAENAQCIPNTRLSTIIGAEVVGVFARERERRARTRSPWVIPELAQAREEREFDALLKTYISIALAGYGIPKMVAKTMVELAGKIRTERRAEALEAIAQYAVQYPTEAGKTIDELGLDKMAGAANRNLDLPLFLKNVSALWKALSFLSMDGGTERRETLNSIVDYSFTFEGNMPTFILGVAALTLPIITLLDVEGKIGELMEFLPLFNQEKVRGAVEVVQEPAFLEEVLCRVGLQTRSEDAMRSVASLAITYSGSELQTALHSSLDCMLTYTLRSEEVIPYAEALSQDEVREVVLGFSEVVQEGIMDGLVFAAWVTGDSEKVKRAANCVAHPLEPCHMHLFEFHPLEKLQEAGFEIRFVTALGQERPLHWADALASEFERDDLRLLMVSAVNAPHGDVSVIGKIRELGRSEFLRNEKRQSIFLIAPGVYLLTDDAEAANRIYDFFFHLANSPSREKDAEVFLNILGAVLFENPVNPEVVKDVSNAVTLLRDYGEINRALWSLEWTWNGTHDPILLGRVARGYLELGGERNQLYEALQPILEKARNHTLEENQTEIEGVLAGFGF